MNQGLDFLKERLSERAAALLLGAGFSFGAKNLGGNDLLLGKDLSEKLYNHFYIECPPSKDAEYIKSVSQYKQDLKKICSILRSEGRQDIRDEYLSKVFSGCRPSPKHYQEKIKNYSWDTIFTLNIDDLVENIFSTAKAPLSVWNYSQNGSRMANVQTLIKLHGDVHCPDDGFVFDDDEYSSFTVENNCLLKEFAHVFLSRDMVILGSSFQEYDISFVLKLYETAGYDNNGCHYFFVVPELNDIILKNKIENTVNFHWIQMDAETFLNYISKEIVQVANNRNILKERGAIFIDEVPIQENYTSQIYYGKPTQYNDIFGEWDIIYPNQMPLIKKVISKHKQVTIITLFGKTYTGKTTVGKRCLVDLKNNGYIAIEILRMGFDVYDSLSVYLASLSAQSQVALFIENAAYQYEHIVNFAQKHFNDVNHLVIITTDSEQNHAGRNHNLLNLPETIEWHNFEISEKISPEFAAKIFFKLCSKKRLNNYLRYCAPDTKPTKSQNMSRIWAEMKKTDDIVDVLYFSSEGKYFRDYYTNWLITHQDKYYDEYLYVLAAFGKLGIASLPIQILSKLIPHKSSKFNAQKFLTCYPDIVEEKNGRIKLLRGRLISAVLNSTHSDTLMNAIYQLVRYNIGLFQENDESEAYELFQKVLRIKRIRNYSLLTSSQLEELFISLEKHCAHISYFWVQYGLAVQLNKRFEDANNHFLYAQNIRPNSYQVAHALAKNRMEIGLDSLRKGKASADENFQLGCDSMLSIINNPRYSRAFSYSVHSYAAMLMKYYTVKNQTIPDGKCEELDKFFNLLMEKQIDTNTKEIIIAFYRYCEKNSITQYCKGLDSIWHMTPYVVLDEDDMGDIVELS